MSDTFFEELGIPAPNTNLGCGGGTQAEQTANIMVAFEKDLMANPCDIVLVVGDVTSTMACSIVAKKLNTRVAHVEAGSDRLGRNHGGDYRDGVPCITLRDNTERPETCTVGTNKLVGTNPDAIRSALELLYSGGWKKGVIPELWDGHAAERIVEILCKL